MYVEAFINKWGIAGGLIRQSDSARILNISEARVNQICKEGKMRKLKLKDKDRIMTFISFADVLKIKEEREKERS